MKTHGPRVVWRLGARWKPERIYSASMLLEEGKEGVLSYSPGTPTGSLSIVSFSPLALMVRDGFGVMIARSTMRLMVWATTALMVIIWHNLSTVIAMNIALA